MKKLLIAAGAASLALAAMPVVGVFAASDPANITDTFKITIADSCTWTRSGANGSGQGAATFNDGVYSATLTAGATVPTFGTTTLNVKCNNGTGYTITPTITDLNGYKNSIDRTTNNDKFEYANALAGGKWTAAYNSTALVDGTPFVSAGTGSDMVDGTNYVITYGVQAATTQNAGYYEGTITYALAQQ